jgi:UDP:flavonoid glycosyltransferase YjiC (YdhE family)
LDGPFGETRRHQAPILNGWSPRVLPHPPDWGSHLPVTGYWFLDHPEDWTPPDGLQDFLDSGPPPVSVGFGSMGGARSEELATSVLRALAKTGDRAVLVTSWGGLGNADLPDTVFKANEVPYDWLFPRVRAAVHHGGAGTTAASLRAGAPTVVVPFFTDQSFWGARVASLGVGAHPIPQAKLSADRLAAALEETRGAGMRERARVLGEKIRAEDGVARAVEAFHRFV